MIVPFAARRVASGELPVTSQEARQRLTGSIAGGDYAEVQRNALKANPSRLLCRQVCGDCGRRWQAPAAGACPTCHSTKTTIEGAVPCMALRV